MRHPCLIVLGFALALAPAIGARDRPGRAHRAHEKERAKPPPPPKKRVDARGDELPPGAVARLGSLRFRHPPSALAVAFASAKILLGGGGAGLAAFSVPDGKPGKVHGAADRELVRMVISPDGKRVAAGLAAGGAELAELASGSTIASARGPGGPLVTLAFARDGNALAAWGDGAVKWLGGPRGAHYWLDPPLAAAALSPDGRTLVASHGFGALEVRDARTGARERLVDAPAGEVHALALSPDGARLACEAGDTVAFVRMRDGSIERTVELTMTPALGPHALAYSPDGRSVALSSRAGEVQLLDAATGAARATIACGSSGLPRARPAFAFAPGGALVATAGEGLAVRLWDAKTGAEVNPLPGHREAVDVLAWAPGTQALATAAADGTVRLWNAPTGEERQVYRAGEAAAAGAGFLADGLLIAWSAVGSALIVRDVASGAKLCEIPAPAAARPETTAPPPPPLASASSPAEPPSGHLAAALPDLFALKQSAGEVAQRVAAAALGDPAAREAMEGATAPPVPARPRAALCGETGLLAVLDGRAVRFHDVRAGVAAKVVELDSPATAAAFSPDGSALAVGAEDGTVVLADVATGDRRVRPAPPGESGDPAVADVAFGADGQTYAWLTVGGTVGLARRSATDVARWPAGQGDGARAIALSADGRWLATGGADGVRVFEVVTRQEIAHLTGHQGDVLELAFSSDSRLLASAAADGTVLVWDAQRFETLIR